MRKPAKLLLLISILALPFKAEAPRSTYDLWNEFSLDARVWAQFYEHRNPQELNAQELHSWRLTKQAWRVVEKRIDQEYEQ